MGAEERILEAIGRAERGKKKALAEAERELGEIRGLIERHGTEADHREERLVLLANKLDLHVRCFTGVMAVAAKHDEEIASLKFLLED